MDALKIELLLTRPDTLTEGELPVEDEAHHARILERNERICATLRKQFPGLQAGRVAEHYDVRLEEGEPEEVLEGCLSRTRLLRDETKERTLHICLWDDAARADLFITPASPADLALNLGTFSALVTALADETGLSIHTPGKGTIDRAGIRAEIDRLVEEQQALIARQKAKERWAERLFWPVLAVLTVVIGSLLLRYGMEGVRDAETISAVDVASPRRLVVINTEPSGHALVVLGKIADTGEAARTKIHPSLAASAPPGSELIVFPRWDAAGEYVERFEYQGMQPVWMLRGIPFSGKTVFSLFALASAVAAFHFSYLRHPSGERRARRIAFVFAAPLFALIGGLIAVKILLPVWLG